MQYPLLTGSAQMKQQNGRFLVIAFLPSLSCHLRLTGVELEIAALEIGEGSTIEAARLRLFVGLGGGEGHARGFGCDPAYWHRLLHNEI